jgi:hypothetical protein
MLRHSRRIIDGTLAVEREFRPDIPDQRLVTLTTPKAVDRTVPGNTAGVVDQR